MAWRDYCLTNFEWVQPRVRRAYRARWDRSYYCVCWGFISNGKPRNGTCVWKVHRSKQRRPRRSCWYSPWTVTFTRREALQRHSLAEAQSSVLVLLTQSVWNWDGWWSVKGDHLALSVLFCFNIMFTFQTGTLDFWHPAFVIIQITSRLQRYIQIFVCNTCTSSASVLIFVLKSYFLPDLKSAMKTLAARAWSMELKQSTWRECLHGSSPGLGYSRAGRWAFGLEKSTTWRLRMW